jgi:deoxyribodipyrimidine photo-lyase
LVWFRHDLRVDDNPALLAAARRDGPVVPVFIWSPDEEGRHAPGAASRWWLHQSLVYQQIALGELGSQLVIRRGPALAALRDLLEETGAKAVFWNLRFEPAVVKRDTRIKAELVKAGVLVESHNGSLLLEPWSVQTRQGGPYRVFTPFWKACQTLAPPPQPEPSPARLKRPSQWPDSLPVSDLGLEPRIDWAAGFREVWHPGEAGARDRLERFCKEGLTDYATARDRPDEPGTSGLSPHLHFGEISVRRVWHTIGKRASFASRGKQGEGADAFTRELGWREFAHHILFHFPETPEEPLQKSFTDFPWNRNSKLLKVWQNGRTGYPIVDAGMRELWHTGWMHNRVRMIAASFLVKDLLIPWQDGARWFWDTLVDADLANNTLGWQWTAGCGADAAPFFRIFNPTSQGEKFDPNGDYVRRWVPELAGLTTRWVHRPSEAPSDVLASAGIVLGETYPRVIVDHREASRRALEAFRLERQ